MASNEETEMGEALEDLVQKNYRLLKKRLQVDKLIPYFIERHLLDFPEDRQVIMSKVTTQGKAVALLELLCEKGTCTAQVFVDILRKGDHTHVADQLQWTKTGTETAQGAQVFISHAGPEKERFVRPLVDQLQQEGLPVDRIFYDQISLRHGDDFDAKIRSTLSSESLKLVVFVISNHVLSDRHWPKLEWELTLKANKRVLPIWLDQNHDGFTAFGNKVRKYSPTLKKTVAKKVLVSEARREIPGVAREIMGMLETQ